MTALKTALGKDVIEVGKQFYIRASSSLADDRTRVLLNGDTFAIFDRGGDIHPLGIGQQGIFHQETRHLSRLELRINGIRPLLLSSAIREDNVLFAVDMTNPDLRTASGDSMPRGNLHIYRAKFLTDSACYDRVTVHNYGDKPYDIDLSFEFEADFADIFEVRGEKRLHRGDHFPDEVERAGVMMSYEGLDHICRSTRIDCSAETSSAREGEITVPLHLDAQGETSFTLTVECPRGSERGHTQHYFEALQHTNQSR